MKNRIDQLFAVTAPGLESVCAEELALLGLTNRIVPGGVEFSGGLREIYLTNLWLRCSSRILVRWEEFRCRDFPALYRKALLLPWGRYLKKETPLKIRVTCHRSRLQHTGRIAETLRQAADRALGRASSDLAAESDQWLMVRMEDDVCRLSVDSSGELLHRRGYREDIGPAPMRETLAAGILRLLQWNGGVPLVDPMCGSGTFPIEAALLAGHYAPGSRRSFAFMKWPRYRPGLWQALLNEASSSALEVETLIAGSDCDNLVVAAAARNAERAGVRGKIVLSRAELGELQPVEGPGLVLCNPPYGTRLGCDRELVSLYRRLGKTCRESFKGWRFAMICPDPNLAKATGIPLRQLSMLRNGGIEVALLTGDL
ncbi:MAG: class I SAM-dependent RNA methyltransferase [Syntrophotaleaceae bacterium]